MSSTATPALAALVSLILSEPSLAATWHILADGTGDAATIQGGIGLASDGDSVLVGPGTYNEQINFLGKDIVVKGLMGASATVLDGTGLGQYGVLFVSGETRSAVLEGVTVTNSIRGIGIFESEPSVLSNIITGNGGPFLSGGIVCTGNNGGPWSPLFRENVVSLNVAGGTGPGIAAFQEMTPEIADNTIIANHAGLGDGGGIYIVTAYDGTIIRGNWIQDNYAGDHGGGIYVAGVPSAVIVEISENILWNNRADGRAETGESGGGIWLEETNVWVHHNTIVQSTGNGPNNTYGGALAIHQPGSPIIEQNVIVYTQNGGGIFCHSGATPVIRNNLAWQNLPVDGAGLCEVWTQGNGNLVADPLFCDMAGGVFLVGQSSPALTHPAGPLGAFPTPGCQPILVQQVTWSNLKTRFPGR